jgi:hypothetical protein
MMVAILVRGDGFAVKPEVKKGTGFAKTGTARELL